MLNSAEMATADMVKDRDADLAIPQRLAALANMMGSNQLHVINANKLAWWLRKNVGRWMDGKRIIMVDGDAKRTQWRIEGAQHVERPIALAWGIGDLDDGVPF